MSILKDVLDIKDQIINIRRDIHMYPEMGFEVHRTAGLAAKHLEDLGLEVKTGVGKTGVVGNLFISEDLPTVALRADMDALPIQETGDVPYKSKVENVMHACGHDGHTAMLLGAATILTNKKDHLKCNVRFLFQPAEEGDGGARFMIEDGCLENVDEIYGLHLWNYQDSGEVGIAPGAVLSCADKFTVVIKGIGGHGATPQGTRDSVVIAASLVTALQTIVSRNINPLESGVVTVGKINGGSNFNVIADKVTIEGTVRAYTEENRSLIKTRMKDLIHGMEIAQGIKIDFIYEDGYPPTINHGSATEHIRKAAEKIAPGKVVPPYLSMGGEDFSYYLQRVQGCFAFIGSRPMDREPMSIPHHCSHFDIDENALLIGTSVLVQLVNDFDRKK